MMVHTEAIPMRLLTQLRQGIVSPMSPNDGSAVRVSSQGIAAVSVVFIVCLCVLFQMLGAPVTLLGVLISDTPAESLSEDFSIPPIAPEPDTPGGFSLYTEFQPSVHLPIFSTAVFHPPQG